MRHKVAIFVVAAILPLTQPTWGIHARIWAQEEQQRARIANAQAELKAAKAQIEAFIKEALDKGDEERAAQGKAKLEAIEAQSRELAARVEQIRARQKEVAFLDEHPEIATARDQVKHLRAAHGHLKEGGFPDMAEMVARRAEEIQQAIEKHQAERNASENNRNGDSRSAERQTMENALREFGGALRQLREEVRQMREEVAELRKRRDTPDTAR